MVGIACEKTGAVYPDWLPDDVRHYLVHTEDGRSIRAVARQAGLHASTVLRQVRRTETRRDDPVLDGAIARLARDTRLSRPKSSEDRNQMKAQIRITAGQFPDEDRINYEARRILRRLGEPQACLAIAPGMEKAVVVRELPDGRTIRTAVVDREVAEAFVIKD